MERTDLGVFYSLPTTPVDRSRFERYLLAAGARRVMLTYDHAYKGPPGEPGDLEYFHALGCHLTVRMDEHNYGYPGAEVAAAVRLGAWRGLVDTVIVGCEPEGKYNMSWHVPEGAAGWGNTVQDAERAGARTAFGHAAAVDSMRRTVQSLGLKAASPGWRQRCIDGRLHEETSDDGPQPGLSHWEEATRAAYNRCDFNCEHLYTYDGTDYDLRERAERHLTRAISRRHKRVIFDEFSVGDADLTPEEHMAACLRMAELFLRTDRVEAAYPFVMSGDPGPHGERWPASMLMSSEVCYAYMAGWLGEKD